MALPIGRHILGDALSAQDGPPANGATFEVLGLVLRHDRNLATRR
jgi:hypothetical protein